MPAWFRSRPRWSERTEAAEPRHRYVSRSAPPLQDGSSTSPRDRYRRSPFSHRVRVPLARPGRQRRFDVSGGRLFPMCPGSDRGVDGRSKSASLTLRGHPRRWRRSVLRRGKALSGASDGKAHGFAWGFLTPPIRRLPLSLSQTAPHPRAALNRCPPSGDRSCRSSRASPRTRRGAAFTKVFNPAQNERPTPTSLPTLGRTAS
jgi:hypothetical protein